MLLGGVFVVARGRGFAVDEEEGGEDEIDVATEGRNRGDEEVEDEGDTGLDVGEEGENDADFVAGNGDFPGRGSSNLGFGLFVCFVPKIFIHQKYK